MTDVLERDLVTYDPLSEVTRKERTALLGFSMLGLALVVVPLVPEKLSVLGIDFTKPSQKAFLGLYALLLAYYLCAFLLYALTDLVSWKRGEHIRYAAYREAASSKEHRGFLERPPDGPPALARRAVPMPVYRGLASYTAAVIASRARAAFEFALPVLFSVYVMFRLLTAVP